MTSSIEPAGADQSLLARITRRLGDAIGRASADERSRPGESIHRSPGRASITLATSLSILAALLLPTQTAQILGLPGILLVAGGAIAGSRRSIGYGFASLVLGLVVAGLQGIDPLALVLCAFCATLAWDVGRYGITVGEQLGRDGSTIRIELAHAIASATIGLAGVAIGYATYLVGPGGQPVPAVALVLLGAVVLVTAMRT